MASWAKETKWTVERPIAFADAGGPPGWTWHRTLCGYGKRCLHVSAWCHTEAGAYNDLVQHMRTDHGTIPT
jgi:hypothetical protein